VHDVRRPLTGRLLSHGLLRERATSVPATDSKVAWLYTRSSDVTDTYLPPFSRAVQFDSGHFCGSLNALVRLSYSSGLAARKCPSRWATVAPATQCLVWNVTKDRVVWQSPATACPVAEWRVWKQPKGRFTHSMPCPCRDPALLRQCRVLRESPRGSRKYPNC